ncbi:hypothetical protein FB03_08625 [Actinotignum schaalii]|nr:hypothetical protein FB03_08625 [Actinotignum schaalii]
MGHAAGATARGTGATYLTTFFHHLPIMPDRAAQSYRCSPWLVAHYGALVPLAMPISTARYAGLPQRRAPTVRRLLRQGLRRLPARACGVLGLVVDLEEKND